MASKVGGGIRRWIDWSTRVPGGLAAHPVAIGALLALVINDHLLKQLVPGFVTGKASDVAGLVMAPLMIVAALELTGRTRPSDRIRIAAYTCLTVAAAFLVVKSFPPATGVYNGLLGLLQWLVGGGFVEGRSVVPTRVVTDPSDLLAIPAVFIAFVVTGSRHVLPAMPAKRFPALSVAVLFVAGLASVATSPAMRSSSDTYEEDLALTQQAPAIARHILVDITNRDPKLADITLLADWYSEVNNVRGPTPGVLLSLVPDDPNGPVYAGWNYSVPNLTLTDACRMSCSLGATVVVRLEDPDLASKGPVTTHLEVTLYAGASEEGTGEVDIDLGLSNDAQNEFAGAPVTLVERAGGSFHVGSDVTEFVDHYRITIDGSILAEPYGFPLIGQIEVGATGERSTGHPNAHDTSFEFSSSTIQSPDYPYSFARIIYDDPPWNQPTIADLLPLCEAGVTCVIEADLTSYYEEYINDPPASGATPPPRSIDLDWYLEVRIEAFDGRALPSGAITIERVD